MKRNERVRDGSFLAHRARFLIFQRSFTLSIRHNATSILIHVSYERNVLHILHARERLVRILRPLIAN
jgi:hypothetical protein